MSQMLKDKRVSRGTRMAELVGEAAEQDETFWNDDIWQEAESDEDSFVQEEEKPDVFDSDFNDSETEEETDSDDEKKSNKRDSNTASHNRYKEPQKLKSHSVGAQAADGQEKKKPKIVKQRFDDMDTTSLRTVRHSTKAKTINADVARNVKEEHEKLRAKPSQRRVRAQFKQKELLEESLATEEFNQKWLVTQKLVEDERSQADKPAKQVSNESYIRFSSRRGSCTTITFSQVECMPAVLNGSQSAPDVPDNMCVVTGLPARYRDPRSGKPYRDLAAYRELRRRYPQDYEDSHAMQM